MFFSDDEETWFFCEFKVIDNRLPDTDVIGGNDGCYFCKDTRCAWVCGDDFDDPPFHVRGDFFQMTGWEKVREDFLEVWFFCDDVSGGAYCASIDIECSCDF